MENDVIKKIQFSSAYISERINHQPEFLLILGSGDSSYLKKLNDISNEKRCKNKK